MVAFAIEDPSPISKDGMTIEMVVFLVVVVVVLSWVVGLDS